jgi:hypothetical protein
MDKLKLYCEKITVSDVNEEQLLYFGNVDESIVKKNNTFKLFSIKDFLTYVEYSSIEDCDFILLPQKVNPNQNLNDLINLSKKHNKKILLFYNDDNSEIFNFENSVIFRTSILKSEKPTNYYSLPAFCDDLKKQKHFFREYSKNPTIGFCGALTHPLRKKIINQLENTKLINKNFILRKNFWGGDVWGDLVRSEYINNTLNSDFVICCRGGGNFSYRLYETICLGRIPIIIDTDIDLPFDEFLSYKENLLIIDESKIENIEDFIMDYWINIENYHILQKNLIELWENTFSHMGFIKNLILHKNEINNLLHTKP